jgi:hypothetical protein
MLRLGANINLISNWIERSAETNLGAAGTSARATTEPIPSAQLYFMGAAVVCELYCQ